MNHGKRLEDVDLVGDLNAYALPTPPAKEVLPRLLADLPPGTEPALWTPLGPV